MFIYNMINMINISGHKNGHKKIYNRSYFSFKCKLSKYYI